MTSSNGNIFRVTGPLCGEFTGPGEFPTQRPVTRSFDVFFDRRLNNRLSKQPWGWWLETLSYSLWRQSNDNKCITKWRSPWPIFCLWLSKVSALSRINYTRDVILTFLWLLPLSAMNKKNWPRREIAFSSENWITMADHHQRLSIYEYFENNSHHKLCQRHHKMFGQIIE